MADLAVAGCVSSDQLCISVWVVWRGRLILIDQNPYDATVPRCHPPMVLGLSVPKEVPGQKWEVTQDNQGRYWALWKVRFRKRLQGAGL